MAHHNMKTAILLASCIVGAVAASCSSKRSSTGTVSLMGPGPLVAEDYTAFMDCVKATNISYRAYEDSGLLVVIPPNSRKMDFAAGGTDDALGQCISHSTSTLSLAAESSVYGSKAHSNSILLGMLPWQKALDMGITGQQVVGNRTTPDRIFNVDSAENVYYYYAYPSDYRDCDGYDANPTHVGQCQSVASKYLGFAAENLDNCATLQFRIWPHHNCQNGDERTIWIAPATACPCQERDTYSWNGVYYYE